MSENHNSFAALQLPDTLLRALGDAGYESPSPIQAEVIPYIVQGKDVIGQAQTGTGKTAAFALPLLANIDLKNTKTQVLIVTPTRELAIQVAEAMQTYARYLKGFRVAPIYGGQDFRPQLKKLQRGLHVVVGTPGRVMDHMRRGTLKLNELSCLVLDEADEMLRMGFIEDVEWILEQLPKKRQIALFSATMPNEIRRIAKRYLVSPEQVSIKQRTSTAETIVQRYLTVKGHQKLDALTRVLEVEDFEAVLCFVRTKTATIELSEKLNARGFVSAALNGDIAQRKREETIESLKSGAIDIVVATDVAARGLDVDRVSHVINFDIPYDTEAYIHRIGRTGRAGRRGDALLFVTPREKRLLTSIEKATKQSIERMTLPSNEAVLNRRVSDFKQKLGRILDEEGADLEFFEALIEDYRRESGVELSRIAAALSSLAQGDTSIQKIAHISSVENESRKEGRKKERRQRGERRERGSEKNTIRRLEPGMERYRIEVRRTHKISPGSIVGAIANEADIDSEFIGAISIYDRFSTVDLPDGMPPEIFEILQKTRISGRLLKLNKLKKGELDGGRSRSEKGRPRGKSTSDSRRSGKQAGAKKSGGSRAKSKPSHKSKKGPKQKRTANRSKR